MKVTFTRKEARELKNLMNSVEETPTKSFLDLIKDNKLISYTVSEGETEITFEIKPEYMVDYLRTVKKFIRIIVNQARSLYETFVLMQESIDNVVSKHMKGEENNA